MTRAGVRRRVGAGRRACDAAREWASLRGWRETIACWRGRADEGSIGVLTLGVFVLAALLILTVASATAVHLAQLRLGHLADELAVDASDALNRSAYFEGAPEGPGLAQARMEQAVYAHLESRAQGELDGVTVVSVASDDGQTASVTVQLVVYPLFGIEALMPFADGIQLTASSSARTF